MAIAFLEASATLAHTNNILLLACNTVDGKAGLSTYHMPPADWQRERCGFCRMGRTQKAASSDYTTLHPSCH
jgi:hypothetical protein